MSHTEKLSVLNELTNLPTRGKLKNLGYKFQHSEFIKEQFIYGIQRTLLAKKIMVSLDIQGIIFVAFNSAKSAKTIKNIH